MDLWVEVTSGDHTAQGLKSPEYFDQNYGLILYSTKLDAFEYATTPLQPYKYKDRASMYLDGKWFATFMRDRGSNRLSEGTPTVGNTPAVIQQGKERKIDILVENTGRINYGREITDERKGLEDCLIYTSIKLFGYDTRTIPLEDISRLEWKENNNIDHMPCFFKGIFAAKKGVDTFVSFANFDHGYVWINGFNLGRYDSAGPQMPLYLPGAFLKDKGNEIIVLDLDPTGDKNSIDLIDHSILEGDGREMN